MKLSSDEKVLLIVYHHYAPFVFYVLQTLAVSLPFYLGVYFLHPVLPLRYIIYSYLAISIILLFVIIYMALIYWLDKLIITNKRVIFVDWKYLTVKVESEANLCDIQDIISVENGMLSFLPFFQYGKLIVKTSAHTDNVVFPQAPRPNILKKFVTRIMNL